MGDNIEKVSESELVSAESDKSRSVLEKMDENVQKLASASRESLARKGLFDLMTMHLLGETLLQVDAFEYLSESQKERQIALIVDYWSANGYGCSVKMAYDMRGVARTFSRQFIEAQYSEPMANGSRLSFKHFVMLQRIDPANHMSWLKRIRQESISANQLETDLRATNQVQITRQGGRKPTVPKTPPAVIERTRSVLCTAYNYLEEASGSLRGPCLDVPPDKLDLNYVELVEKTISMTEDLLGSLQLAHDDLKKVLSRSQKVLKDLEPEDVASVKPGADSKSTAGAASKGRKRSKQSVEVANG